MKSFQLHSLGQLNLSPSHQSFSINRACCKQTSTQQHRPQLKNSHWKSSHPSCHTPLSNEVRDVLAILFSTQQVATQLASVVWDFPWTSSATMHVKINRHSMSDIPVLPITYLTVSLASTRTQHKTIFCLMLFIGRASFIKHHWVVSNYFLSRLAEEYASNSVQTQNPKTTLQRNLILFLLIPIWFLSIQFHCNMMAETSII